MQQHAILSATQVPPAARARQSRRAWTAEADVLRGRQFDFSKKFLPDALTLVAELDFLTPAEQRLVSQVQGRTYVNLSAMTESLVAGKKRTPITLNAPVQHVGMTVLTDGSHDAARHQRLFRRAAAMIGKNMPAGYRFVPRAQELGVSMRARPAWTVLALSCHLELLASSHYAQCVEAANTTSALFVDIMRHHMREESRHALVDQFELARLNAQLSPREQAHAVSELVASIQAFADALQHQAYADAAYFVDVVERPVGAARRERIRTVFVDAYRGQFLLNALFEPRFRRLLRELISPAGYRLIGDALRNASQPPLH